MGQDSSLLTPAETPPLPLTEMSGCYKAMLGAPEPLTLGPGLVCRGRAFCKVCGWVWPLKSSSPCSLPGSTQVLLLPALPGCPVSFGGLEGFCPGEAEGWVLWSGHAQVGGVDLSVLILTTAVLVAE